jgi:hypothetical protein
MVEIANAASAGVARPIQFFHMPVPKGRTDDAYFTPLDTRQSSTLPLLERPQRGCAVTRRRFPVGANPTRRFAPAGSNRSSHGGNEMAEAFD